MKSVNAIYVEIRLYEIRQYEIHQYITQYGVNTIYIVLNFVLSFVL